MVILYTKIFKMLTRVRILTSIVQLYYKRGRQLLFVLLCNDANILTQTIAAIRDQSGWPVCCLLLHCTPMNRHMIDVVTCIHARA